MRVITWNCNMAFRNKAHRILTYEPDILIVPECEDKNRLQYSLDFRQPTDVMWYGDNPNKGLGIFSFSDYRFKLLPSYNPELKNIIPIRVYGGNLDFNLFAIWANNPNDKDGQYIEQVWKAINYYKCQLTEYGNMLIGDFNSNTIWDKMHKECCHTNVVKQLEELGIRSCYHHFNNEDQGKELQSTFYLHRKKDKPYHIDYCFVSKILLDKLKSIEIGSFEIWKEYSDHVPIIVTF